MKYVLPIVICSAIFAQAIEPTSPINWENLTAQSVLGFVIIWLVTRTLPAWQKQFVDLNTQFVAGTDKALAAVETAQTRFLDAQAASDERRHEDSEKLRETLATLSSNCMAVQARARNTG